MRRKRFDFVKQLGMPLFLTPRPAGLNLVPAWLAGHVVRDVTPGSANAECVADRREPYSSDPQL